MSYVAFSSTEQFDPSAPAPAWTSSAPMPLAVEGHSFSCIGALGTCVAFGGTPSYASGQALSTGFIYNISADIWSSSSAVPALPTPRVSHAAAVVFDAVYLLGGYDGTNVLSSVDRYDAVSNSFTSSPHSMLQARSYFPAVSYNHRIYAMGGTSVFRSVAQGNYGPMSSVEVYSPVTDSWVARASMLDSRAFHAASVSSNGRIFVTGGVSASDGMTNTAQVYTIASNSWLAMPNLLGIRFLHSSISQGSNVFVFAGVGVSGTSTSTLGSGEAYSDQANATWSSVSANLITPRIMPAISCLMSTKAAGVCLLCCLFSFLVCFFLLFAHSLLM